MRKTLTTLLFIVLLAALSCCSNPEPDNLEPTIEVLDAVDVTRTEAELTARVTRRGVSALTRFVFHYGPAGNLNREVAASDPNAATQSLRLTGLTPGVIYEWYVEGGTATASIRSEIKSFTTRPNDRPTVDRPVALSTGPLGIILSIDIVDDGGEPLTEAGCEVVDDSSRESFRVFLPADQLKVGSHKLSIGGLTPETHFRMTPFATNRFGETRGEALSYTTRNSIVLSQPGELAKLFAGIQTVELSQLNISGDMNGDDFRFLRKLLAAPVPPGEERIVSDLKAVDLSEAEIVEGGGSYDGSRFTETDRLTTGLFADCHNLQSIALPTTAVALAKDVFARCQHLTELTVSAEIRSILPSAECDALREINVSPANQYYSSADGVLFDHEVEKIVWFPPGKTGDYELPPTVTAIAESAFTGTKITGLVIPQSVLSIARGAFAGSKLEEISLPDNLTNISEGMFQNCASLKRLRLGESTEFVGDYAVDGTSLEQLIVTAKIPPFTMDEAFYNRSGSLFDKCTLYVPAESKEIYRNHYEWGRFEKIEGF